MSLYKTLIVPVIDYADVAYDTLSAKCSTKLQKIQNSVLKIIYKAEWTTPTKQLHQAANFVFMVGIHHCHIITQFTNAYMGLPHLN